MATRGIPIYPIPSCGVASRVACIGPLRPGPRGDLPPAETTGRRHAKTINLDQDLFIETEGGGGRRLVAAQSADAIWLGLEILELGNGLVEELVEFLTPALALEGINVGNELVLEVLVKGA